MSSVPAEINSNLNPTRAYHVTHLRHWKQYKASPNREPSPKPDKRPKDGESIVSPNGGITVVFKLLLEDSPEHRPVYRVRYGISICCDIDLYNRKKGREDAIKRVEDMSYTGLLKVEERKVVHADKMSLWTRLQPKVPEEPKEYARIPGDWETWPHGAARQPKKVREPVTVRNLAFTGTGEFIIDLPPGAVNERGELWHTSLVHNSLVRSVLQHAVSQVHSAEMDQAATEMYLLALHPWNYPVYLGE